MTATINIWSSKTIATLGMLIFSSIFLIGVANAQCDVDPSITIDQDEVEISPFGNTFCWIDIPYRIINPGPCDMNGFTVFFSVTTPEGTENIVHNITGPLSPNIPIDGSVGFPSVLLKNDIDDACFEVSDVSIVIMISSIDPPTPLTEEIDCPNGDGTITVCVNDNSIVCDESNCTPYPCLADVNSTILIDNLVFTVTDDENCSLEIPYELTNNGNCDIGIFNLEIEVSTSTGLDTIIETITQIDAGATINGNAIFSSLIITDVDGTCLLPADILITPSIPMQGDVITNTIPCPEGNGTIEVCSNNPLIVCDDSNCLPFSCEVNIGLAADINNLIISQQPTGNCELTIPYGVENLGDCQVSAFDIEMTITTPNGTELFIINQTGLTAGSNFSDSFTVASPILITPETACYEASDISVSLAVSQTNPPNTVTTTITCPNGLGTIEVCVNNQSIVCDDSMCELILPLELLSLDGSLNQDEVVIVWETGFELNNDYFSVQHSVDGIAYETIGMISSKGDSNDLTDYEFTHTQPSRGENYYRLIMTDIHGLFEYSKIIVVEMDKKEIDFRLSPNPSSEYIDIQGAQGLSGTLEANIYTTDGRFKMSLELDSSLTRQRVDISQLQSGLYFISIKEGNFVQNLKLIKL